MRYQIFGDNLPAVQIDLEAGEGLYSQSGAMVWMSDGIAMEASMRGGLRKGLGRMLTGDSLFVVDYSAAQPGSITFASSFPGQILTLSVGQGREYICQKNAFLCAQPNVDVSVVVNRGIAGGLFGGEGFLMQRLSGQGLVFLEVDGNLREVDLAPGERLKINTGNIACFESGVRYDVETVKGFKNVLFGGEGLFLTTLTGPGRVWLQTMTVSTLAGRMIPYLPHKD